MSSFTEAQRREIAGLVRDAIRSERATRLSAVGHFVRSRPDIDLATGSLILSVERVVAKAKT